MNFYAFNIGDYAGATRHLSWDEDMAYRRMLDAYYSREAPLPLERRQVYRLVGAAEQRQREAVDAVLEEFFEERADGWHNNRANEEISKAVEKSAVRDEKKESERERQKRHRARRKELFDRLRERGMVPRFDTPTPELEALLTRHAPVTVTERDSVTGENAPSPATRDVTRDSAKVRRDSKIVTRDVTGDIDDVTPDITAINPNPNPNIKEEEEDTRARKSALFDLTEAAIRSIPELGNHPVRSVPVIAPIFKLAWDEGFDVKTQIVPSIRRQAANATRPIRGWGYFVKGIRQDAQTPVIANGARHGSYPSRRPSAAQEMRDAIADVQAHVALGDPGPRD